MKRLLRPLAAALCVTGLCGFIMPVKWTDTTGKHRGDAQSGADYDICFKTARFPSPHARQDFSTSRMTFTAADAKFKSCMHDRGWKLTSAAG